MDSSFPSSGLTGKTAAQQAVHTIFQFLHAKWLGDVRQLVVFHNQNTIGMVLQVGGRVCDITQPGSHFRKTADYSLIDKIPIRLSFPAYHFGEIHQAQFIDSAVRRWQLFALRRFPKRFVLPITGTAGRLIFLNFAFTSFLMAMDGQKKRVFPFRGRPVWV
jgi:hypothetical protein